MELSAFRIFITLLHGLPAASPAQKLTHKGFTGLSAAIPQPFSIGNSNRHSKVQPVTFYEAAALVIARYEAICELHNEDD